MFEHQGIIEYPRLNALYGMECFYMAMLYMASQVLLGLPETGPEKVLDTPIVC